MAAEYVVKEGNAQVILCERGITTFERSTRYTLDISAIPVLKHETHLPVIVDPSHAAGRRTSCCRWRAPRSRRARTGSSSRCILVPRRRSATVRSRFPPADFADFADEIRTLAQLMGRTIG